MDLAQQGFEKDLDEVMAVARKILVEKRALRGTANIQRQGLQGIINRVFEDKFSRVTRFVETQTLRTLLAKRGLPAHQITQITGVVEAPEELIGVEDDLMDIANYCFIAILLLRHRWDDSMRHDR